MNVVFKAEAISDAANRNIPGRLGSVTRIPSDSNLTCVGSDGASSVSLIEKGRRTVKKHPFVTTWVSLQVVLQIVLWSTGHAL